MSNEIYLYPLELKTSSDRVTKFQVIKRVAVQFLQTRKLQRFIERLGFRKQYFSFMCLVFSYNNGTLNRYSEHTNEENNFIF